MCSYVEARFKAADIQACKTVNRFPMTMTSFSAILVSLALLFGKGLALAPSNTPKAKKPAFNLQKTAFNGIAAASLASALVVGPMADAADVWADSPSFGSSSLVAEKVKREGTSSFLLPRHPPYQFLHLNYLFNLISSIFR